MGDGREFGGKRLVAGEGVAFSLLDCGDERAYTWTYREDLFQAAMAAVAGSLR